MSNDLIEKRNERTKQRKEKKRKMDSLIGLAIDNKGRETISLSASVATISDTNQVARLLDEGFCDNGFVLMKGAIEKYLNGKNEYVTGWEMVDGSWKRTDVLNLSEDFVGTVNLGHQDFATHPFILGEFKKNDFTLVDKGDGRKALDVDVRLDEESMYVKELRRQPYDIGVSAEFYYHIDWEATEQLYEDYSMWIPAIDEIFIFAYGLVGECGNVNSSGLELKGETMQIDNANIIDQVDENTEELGVEEIDITETPAEEADNEPETVEEQEEEAAEEADDGEEAEAEEAEEGDEGEGDEADEEESDLEAELSAFRELTEQIQTLTERVGALEEANAKLKKTNRKLSNKLQNENDKKEKFKQAMKGMAVELLPEEETKPKKVKAMDNDYFRSGIGEI